MESEKRRKTNKASLSRELADRTVEPIAQADACASFSFPAGLDVRNDARRPAPSNTLKARSEHPRTRSLVFLQTRLISLDSVGARQFLNPHHQPPIVRVLLRSRPPSTNWSAKSSLESSRLTFMSSLLQSPRRAVAERGKWPSQLLRRLRHARPTEAILVVIRVRNGRPPRFPPTQHCQDGPERGRKL